MRRGRIVQLADLRIGMKIRCWDYQVGIHRGVIYTVKDFDWDLLSVEGIDDAQYFIDRFDHIEHVYIIDSVLIKYANEV